jgi:hypothetical protein
LTDDTQFSPDVLYSWRAAFTGGGVERDVLRGALYASRTLFVVPARRLDRSLRLVLVATKPARERSTRWTRSRRLCRRARGIVVGAGSEREPAPELGPEPESGPTRADAEAAGTAGEKWDACVPPPLRRQENVPARTELTYRRSSRPDANSSSRHHYQHVWLLLSS